MSITCDNLFLLSLLILASVIQTHAYPGGAISSACDDMMPAHNASAQKTANPFKLVLGKACYEEGKPLNITMMSENVTREIEGVLLQARHSDGKFHGEFKKDANFDGFKNLKCPKGDSFTHSKELKKPSFDFVWVPEKSLSGDVIMTYTVVEHLKTFWVKEEKKIPKCGGSNQIKGMLWMVLLVVKLVLW